MEDKTYQLLEKMYSEVTGRLDLLEKGQKELTEDQHEMRSDIKKLSNSVVIIKNKLDNYTKTLFDGYIQHEKRLDRAEESLDLVIEKSDRHEVRLKVIEAGRK